ncbi:hypothetical protein C8R43DRAFT_962098 [Mycena crocata]|nr:hypothetical protein C8R43DRAFT_962098 [Mycena crocata]
MAGAFCSNDISAVTSNDISGGERRTWDIPATMDIWARARWRARWMRRRAGDGVGDAGLGADGTRRGIAAGMNPRRKHEAESTRRDGADELARASGWASGRATGSRREGAGRWWWEEKGERRCKVSARAPFCRTAARTGETRRARRPVGTVQRTRRGRLHVDEVGEGVGGGRRKRAETLRRARSPLELRSGGCATERPPREDARRAGETGRTRDDASATARSSEVGEMEWARGRETARARWSERARTGEMERASETGEMERASATERLRSGGCATEHPRERETLEWARWNERERRGGGDGVGEMACSRWCGRDEAGERRDGVGEREWRARGSGHGCWWWEEKGSGDLARVKVSARALFRWLCRGTASEGGEMRRVGLEARRRWNRVRGSEATVREAPSYSTTSNVASLA